MDSRSLRSMGNPDSRSIHRYCRSWRTHRIGPNHRSRRRDTRRNRNLDVRTRRRSGRTSRERPGCRAGRSGRRWSWWICQPQPGRREFRDPRECDPVAFLEGPAFGLADPMGRNPRPARLRLGPEALLPDHAVLIGEVLSGNVEAVGSRRLTRVVIGTVLGRAVLLVVQPVGLAVAPEAGDAIPAVLIALPVAIDPESTWRRHPPRTRYPDIILAAWIPLPVSLDPLGIGAGRIDRGPFADRGWRGLRHVNRIAVLAGRQKRLVERPFGHRP